MGSPISLIVGLGNPGRDYQNTRHNAGVWFLQALAQQFKIQFTEQPKFFGLAARTEIADQSIHLLIPTTFMNLSGKSVAALAQFFKIPPEAILVVHDELDLLPGIARLKQGGGAGGHNGLKDIIQALGNQNNFQRLRLGIGHPGQASQVSNYVLGAPPASEKQLIEEAIEKALPEIPAIISGDTQAVMNRLNQAK